MSARFCLKVEDRRKRRVMVTQRMASGDGLQQQSHLLIVFLLWISTCLGL